MREFTGPERHASCTVLLIKCKKSEIAMDTIERDIAWLRSQLTVARWHLDAALAAPVGMARRNIDRARQAYEGAREALRDLNLSEETHEVLAKELARVRERLQVAGAEV